jgi:hypothetical protein
MRKGTSAVGNRYQKADEDLLRKLMCGTVDFKVK